MYNYQLRTKKQKQRANKGNANQPINKHSFRTTAAATTIRYWHKGLIHKLSSIGIKGELLHWFRNYISDRKQRVIIANSSSSWKDIYAGVPQGSVIGPLLFLIFINDIVKDINSDIRLFADDTSLYISVDSPDTSAHLLNSDLNRIHLWSKT